MGKDKFKKDILFILILLLLAGIIWCLYALIHNNGDNVVVVTRDGEVVEQYSLSEDNVYIIHYGEEYNLLMISNGEAFVTDADCPDGLCIRQRAISRNGESIICLPHKLVIQVESKEEGSLDAVTY